MKRVRSIDLRKHIDQNISRDIIDRNVGLVGKLSAQNSAINFHNKSAQKEIALVGRVVEDPLRPKSGHSLKDMMKTFFQPHK